jgi:hypothetical protein
MRLDSSVLSLLQETLFCELAEHPGLRNHFPYMGLKGMIEYKIKPAFSARALEGRIFCVCFLLLV